MGLPQMSDVIATTPQVSASAQLLQEIERQSNELALLIIQIQSKVSGLVHATQDDLITDLDRLSSYFAIHGYENSETRDVRLTHILRKLAQIHHRSWKEGRRRSIDTHTSRGWIETLDRDTPITVEEIIELSDRGKRREFRFLLVYGITNDRISEVLGR